MEIYNSAGLLNKKVSSYKENGMMVGFVPTMGALHKGHLSLLDYCISENDISVTSIFVNPTQFNDPDDLKKYPRNLDRDLDLLSQNKCDIAFCPDEKEIYPEPDTRVFDLGMLGDTMEALHRPGHFNGVAQVVTRLFDIVDPDRVYFGIKDFQQVAIVRKVVRDLGYKISIVVCPIVREKDGLAMSSRNVLLDPVQRMIATSISKMLFEAQSLAPVKTVEWIKNHVISVLNCQPQMKVEYFEIVDEDTLMPVNDFRKPAVGCIAVKLGKVRLIDNIYFSL